MIMVSLTKDEWNTAAEHLEQAAEPLSNILLEFNHEGKGRQDKEEFLSEMQLAIAAMRYVSEFAADKCKFIGV